MPSAILPWDFGEQHHRQQHGQQQVVQQSHQHPQRHKARLNFLLKLVKEPPEKGEVIIT